MPLLYSIIIACAISGFSLATFIHLKKRVQKPLICPIGHSCDPVVRSDYSRLFGIPVELLGVLYYFIIILAYSLQLIYPGTTAEGLNVALISLSAFAFLFSLYLTAVQAFILKEWCTWCLISAALCTAILFVSLFVSGIVVESFFFSR